MIDEINQLFLGVVWHIPTCSYLRGHGCVFYVHPLQPAMPLRSMLP